MAKVEGIVVKEMKYKDNSKILTIFTKELGKITIMARGACNPKSRLISNTELFFHNNYELYKGKTFYYINDTDTINSFYSIREDIDRLMYGSYFLELIDLGLIDEAKNETIFKLLLKGLEVLSEKKDNFSRFVLAYEMKFISFLGYRPNFRACVSCDSTKSSRWRFSIREGGIVCENCFHIDKSAIYIKEEDIIYLLDILFTPFDKLEEIKISEDNAYKLHRIMVKYILEKLERTKFNSLEMYNMMSFEGVD